VTLVAQRSRNIGTDRAFAVRSSHVDYTTVQRSLWVAQLSQYAMHALQAEVDGTPPSE
jgi:hypothetical protein